MHSEEPTGQLVVASEQLSSQLKLLGYRKGDTVYLRALYHSDDPRKINDKGKKAEAQSLGQLINIIRGWQNEGRGVYLVINGGGHKDIEVTACRAIFYEHDNLDKDTSRELWRSLELPEPTFQVDTGGKSIHSYWVFDQAIDPVEWKKLQSDLLVHADADRALKNPSRVMRLAGAYHISPGGSFPTTIISASGNRYSFDLLRKAVPSQATQATTQIAQTTLPSKWPTTTDEDIPLSECLRVEERDLIANGVLEGRRNDTGAALARNLIGTSLRLQYLNERFSGDPRLLFDNYCARCSPPLDAKEADQIWKSALKDNPSATLTDDAILNCIKSWKRRQSVLAKNNTTEGSANVSGSKFNFSSNSPNKPVEVSLKERILEITSRGLKSSEEKAALLVLAKQTNTQSKDIEAIAALLRQDLEVEEGRDERKAEINQLLNVSNNSLDLTDFLPQALASPLKLWCKWLNIPESVALTAVLTTTSTLHRVGTELVIHKAMDFAVPPVLFSAIVGESGQKKSPVYRTLIKKPLRVLQNQATQVYEQQLAQYEYELNEWERGTGEACRSSHRAKPEKPGLPLYFFTDATGEGIKTQAQETPSKAMFALIDELAGLFNSANQYRGGKGSDRQDVLSYYDGLGQTVLRAGGIKVDVERIYLSIFGGIQPDVLKEHTKDLKDADGHWARFLFVNQPLAASTLPDDNTDINLKDLLSACYGRIASLPLIQYKLSREAFKRYQEVYNELELKRVGHPQAGMRAVYSKMEGAIGRLALNLHAVKTAMNDSVVAFVNNEISLETINQAIALAEFYIGQIKILHTDSKADKGELSALLAKLLEYASAEGVITLSQATRKFNAIKSTPQALDHFKELEVMGYGRVEKHKRNWVFIPDLNSGYDFQNSCNGLQSLSGNDSKRSCNGSENSCNGLCNDFSELESLSGNDSKRSCNECNDFFEPAHFLDNSEETTSYISVDNFEEKNQQAKNDQNHCIIARKPETLTEQDRAPRNGSCNDPSQSIARNEIEAQSRETEVENSPVAIPSEDPEQSYETEIKNPEAINPADTFLKPLDFSLEVGDRVECYPSEHHAEKKWAVKATVTEVVGQQGWFVSCTIEYRNKKREVLTVRIAGGCVNWILRKL